jgi:hypothetical protein
MQKKRKLKWERQKASSFYNKYSKQLSIFQRSFFSFLLPNIDVDEQGILEAKKLKTIGIHSVSD